MLIRTTTVLASLLVAGGALAHGPQLQITLDQNNKIVTREIVDTTNASGLPGSNLAGYETLTAPTSVFVIPAYLNNSGQYTLQPDNPHYLNGPGYTFRYQTHTPGTNMYFDDAPSGSVNLSGTYFSIQYLSGLTRWDGASFVDAGDTQLQAARSSGGVLQTMTTQDGAAAGSTIAYGGLSSLSTTPHTSLTHLLLGDGSSSTSAVHDGIYRVSVQMSSSSGDIASSDPFDYIIYKGTGVSEALTAAYSLNPAGNVQVVPEPTGLALLGLPGLAMLIRRRRGI